MGSRRSDAHHLLPWALGGGTDLDNLIKLCRLCRRRVHEGVYRIHEKGDGELVFETPSGREIGVVRIAVEPGCERGEGLRRRSRERGLAIEPLTPRALDGTPLDHNYAVSVICDASRWAKARAAPAPA